MLTEIMRWVYAFDLNPAVAFLAVIGLSGLVIASMSILKFK